jgi:hypothetical protein
MGSDDDMFRIWSGPEGSSHKEPLSGIRIHRVHGRFLVPRYGPAGDEVFGVSLVLGCACGIARLPNASSPAGPRRPKITRRGALSEDLIPCFVLLAGFAKTATVFITTQDSSVTSCLRISRARRTIMNQIELK